MSKPIKIEFEFSGGVLHDASVSEISVSQEMCFNSGWSLIPVFSSLDASPTWSLEVSNDNITFYPYDDLTDDAAIDQGFDDTHSSFLYWRINYNAQTNTTGTVSFDLILKK